MVYSQDELETILAVRGIVGCEGFTEEECLEVWGESMLLGMVEE